MLRPQLNKYNKKGYMEKKIYVSPKTEISLVEVQCDILDVSSSGSLPGTESGGESQGGMDADANEREDFEDAEGAIWGSLW